MKVLEHSLRAALALGLLGMIGLAGATAVGLSGCDLGLQKQLDDQKDARFAEARAALEAIEKARYEAIAKGFPKDAKKPEGRAKHPYVLWRFQVPDMKYHYVHTAPDGKKTEADLTYEEALDKLAEDYAGTPTEGAAHDAAAFAKNSAEFWVAARKNNYGRMSGTVSRYVKFLQGYMATSAKEAAEAKKAGDATFVPRPFQDEAAFDVTFTHVGRFYAGTNPIPFWELAFNFPAQGAATPSRYVTRLCRESEIREKCKSVPAEFRPAAIQKPYFQWLVDHAKAFDSAHDVAVFDDVMRTAVKDVTAAQAALPKLIEDPVMPESFADRAASRGFQWEMSKRSGALLVGRGMGNLVLAEKYDGKLPAGSAAKIAKRIEELKATAGSTVSYETVVLEAERDMPGATLRDVLRAVPLADVRKFDLVGRRRADESLKRVGFLLRLPDKPATESYQLQGQEERTKCPYMGHGGKLGRRTKPGSVLVVSGDRIRGATLSREAPDAPLVAGKLTLDAARTDVAAISAWADKNHGIVRLFVDKSMSYDDIMQLVTGVAYKCIDTDVKYGLKLDKTLHIKCGKSEQRDIDLALSVCGG